MRFPIKKSPLLFLNIKNSRFAKFKKTMELDLEKGELVLIDKPLNWTSFDVVAKMRGRLTKKFGKKVKIGHAGTLDPLATGLLIICIGKMTKSIDTFQAQTKEYTGEITLGKTTPSYDLETDFDSEKPYEHLTNTQIKEATKLFIGDIAQIPPIYSAVKIDGKAAYLSARKGKDIEMKAKNISITQFEITSITLPKVTFLVNCSKGTYIRSLANDFGQELGTGAHLSALRRTKIGDFSVENAISPEKWIALFEQTEG